MEEDQDVLVDLTIDKISSGDFLEDIDLPKEEKGQTIARLIPDDETIQVFENKSTQSDNAEFDKDQIKNEELEDTMGQSDSYEKVEEKVGIGNDVKSSHNLIQLPEPKINGTGQEILVQETDIQNNNVEKDNNNEFYEEKKSESILDEDLGKNNEPSNKNKESKTEAEDLSQLEKQEESKINSSSIEELFASNVEKETESNSIKEGKSDQGASKMGEESMSTWKFLLDDIMTLAENSSDQDIKEMIPAKIYEVKKIFDELEEKFTPKTVEVKTPPPPPPAPPPPPPPMKSQPLKLKGINVCKNHGVEVRVTKNLMGGPPQGGDLINELKNAFKTKLRSRGLKRNSAQLQRISFQRNQTV